MIVPLALFPLRLQIPNFSNSVTILGFKFYPIYAIPALIGLLLVLLYPTTRYVRDPRSRRQYILLQIITFIAAIVGAKIAVWFAEMSWTTDAHPFSALVHSGRSIVGGLILGLLAAEIAKLVIGYRMPPNDRFAVLVPFSIAIGRVGCLLFGCCRGSPTESAIAICYDDHIWRHPAAFYELVFQLACALTFITLVRRRILLGRIFSLYLILYGLFRFFIEFIRETPRHFAGVSGYQILSLAMIALGAIFLIVRSVRHSTWIDSFLPQPAATPVPS